MSAVCRCFCSVGCREEGCWEQKIKINPKRYRKRATLSQKGSKNDQDGVERVSLSPTLCFHLNNMRAAPRLSYIAQLCDITKEIINAEFKAPQSICHLPHNTVPKASYAHLHKAGQRKVTPYWITAKAALLRTAVKTCKCCRRTRRTSAVSGRARPESPYRHDCGNQLCLHAYPT